LKLNIVGMILVTALTLSACSTTDGTAALINTPARAASSFAIKYNAASFKVIAPPAASSPNAPQVPLQTPAEFHETLRKAGYFELKERIDRLAPEVLASDHIAVHPFNPNAVKTPSLDGVTTPNLAPTGSVDPQVLLITPVAVAAYRDATDIKLTFNVSFRDARKGGLVYWSGLYKTEAISSMKSDEVLDDDAVRHLLRHIFDDMEGYGLIAAAKSN